MKKELINNMKRAAARKAVDYLGSDIILGVGSGSTVGFFIEELEFVKHKIKGAVASSLDTKRRLLELGIDVFDLNSVNGIDVYVDGADEINKHLQMIKGGGAALTREKICASAANKFICIADRTKYVDVLGKFDLPIEVLEVSRSFVAREIIKIGGIPIYRQHVVTDNGNQIIDIKGLEMLDPLALEFKLNNIAGVVENGIFANRKADLLLLAKDKNDVTEIYTS